MCIVKPTENNKITKQIYSLLAKKITLNYKKSIKVNQIKKDKVKNLIIKSSQWKSVKF